MDKVLLFVLLLNNPDGSQVAVETGPVAVKVCEAMVAGVNAVDWPQVGADEVDGAPVWQYEATCAAPALAGQLGGGWRDPN